VDRDFAVSDLAPKNAHTHTPWYSYPPELFSVDATTYSGVTV